LFLYLQKNGNTKTNIRLYYWGLNPFLLLYNDGSTLCYTDYETDWIGVVRLKSCFRNYKMSLQKQIFDFTVDEDSTLFIRVFRDQTGEPLFVARDVCQVLEYNDTTQAIRKNVSPEYVFSISDVVPSPRHPPGTQPRTKLINECGLYELIFSSRMDRAKLFKKWVFEDVLPSLRKTGRYDMSQSDRDRDKRLEIYQVVFQVFQQMGSMTEERNRIMFEDYGRTLMIENGRTDLPQEYSVTRRLTERFDVRPDVATRMARSIGRRLAKQYRIEYEREPAVRQQWVDGTARSVKHYTEEEWENCLDDVVRSYLDSKQQSK
jgi:prophage antirepressor-like protein